MSSVFRILAIVALAPVALAACENPAKPKAVLHSGFGDAVRHNMAVQLVNPEGSQDFGPTPMDGDRAGIAVTRYRTGQTEEVVEQRTADVGDGS